MPQASIDPVIMAAATVMRLQTIVSREVAAAEAAVVTVGALQAGTKGVRPVTDVLEGREPHTG
jgi:hippurate hydrolase